MSTDARNSRLAATAMLVLALAGCVVRPTWRGDEAAAYDVLNRSTIALLEIDRDALAGPLGASLRHACAVLVFPGKVDGVHPAPGTCGDGVLLVRDGPTGRWTGPAFYALRRRDGDAGPAPGEHADVHRWLIALGCDALHPLYAGGGSATAATIELDDAADMTAWSLSPRRADRASLATMALRPLPAFALAYYQQPASLPAIALDRSLHNDASAEILAAIRTVAN
ncbi:MAG: hypothetical protein ACJ8GJ_07115 [Vitreoscilla sp.]